ncbi:hypothetical protein RclHR1_05460004 [Rhizophagus clarus]|uniref:Phosphatidate cytidylyltransferase, mitochondrial n=1 Tax=Rhizophagus clarus TaxID=94130 RepID=A0A2Z6RNY1_9GLOM|nr:hypothetical protein RclHR1_05460004 [Rhizophagus clarus]GES91365.1 mitochondrial import protein mmp37 [Rhizophagus clarus]
MSVRTTSKFRAINKTSSTNSFRSLRYIYSTSKLNATPTTEHTPSTSSSATNPVPPSLSSILKGASTSKQFRITARHSLELHPKFGKNQNLPINHEFNERLRGLLNNFHAPIRYAIAYGSGVFPQKGYDYDKNKPMIDFIFAVGHTQHWHSLNINQNRKHYSFLGTLGSGAVAMLQENFGAGAYYNPYVKIDDMMIKYGVVSIDRMCKDLLNWETLYLAGRMHKPVKILKDDPRVRLAQQVNLASALRTALLLLPKDFTEENLYMTISSISYKGDFRTYFGENPNKIKNVVSKQMNNFNLLYGGLIRGLPMVNFVANGKLQQDDSPKAKAQMIQKLPRTLKYKIQEEHRMVLASKGIQWPSDDMDACKSIVNSGNYIEYINTSLEDIIFRPTLSQSIKGILSAGLSKSTKYTFSKIGKWISSP